MHLLKAQAGSVADGVEAVDLGQDPGDILILSAADTELANLAAAAAELGPGLPSLRLANLMQLTHNLSVDLYVDRVVAIVPGGPGGRVHVSRRRRARERGGDPGMDRPPGRVAPVRGYGKMQRLRLETAELVGNDRHQTCFRTVRRIMRRKCHRSEN